jgi:hypothetical protein
VSCYKIRPARRAEPGLVIAAVAVTHPVFSHDSPRSYATFSLLINIAKVNIYSAKEFDKQNEL